MCTSVPIVSSQVLRDSVCLKHWNWSMATKIPVSRMEKLRCLGPCRSASSVIREPGRSRVISDLASEFQGLQMHLPIND
jgi:hypothetical protein